MGVLIKMRNKSFCKIPDEVQGLFKMLNLILKGGRK